MRVQIPAYTDRWMMGDRFGDVIGTYERRVADLPDVTIAKVRLDISGKVVKVNLDDCTVVDVGVS